MTKKELNKIIEIICNLTSPEEIIDICEICKNDFLTNEMKKAIESGNENDLFNAMEQLKTFIHSHVPSELMDYYYIRLVDNGIAEHLLNEEQKEKADAVYSNKIEEVITLQDDEKKIIYSREIQKSKVKLKILKTLSDVNKLKILDELDENERYEVALEIIDDNILLLAMDKVDDYLKLSLAEKIKSSEMKVQALDKLNFGKLGVIQTIEEPDVKLIALDKLSKTDKVFLAVHEENMDIKRKILEQAEGQDKVAIARSITDPKQRVQVLDMLEGADKLEVALSLEDPVVMLQARDMFAGNEKFEIIEKIKDMLQHQKNEGESILKKIYDKNPNYNLIDVRLPDMLETINYMILDKKYIDTLGIDIIAGIAMSNGPQKQILSLDDKKYEIFYKCLNSYLYETKTEDWRPMAQKLLEHIQSGHYNDFIENIEDLGQIDFYKLSIIMQKANQYGIKTVEDVINYQEIVRQDCDEIMKGDHELPEKKSAVLRKLFGQDIEYAKKIIDQFGEDIANIDDSDEKDFVASLIAIMELDDEIVLQEIYEQGEEIGLIDGMAVQRNLKNAYAKKIDEGLYQPKNEDLIPQEELDKEFQEQGLRVYDAGTDFKMIIHSIAALGQNKRDISGSYKSDWNQPVGKDVHHVCTSYIRNDMCGAAPAKHFYYGFSRNEPGCIMWSI